MWQKGTATYQQRFSWNYSSSTYYFGRKIIGDLAGNVIIAQGSAEPSVVRTYVMLVLTFVP